MVLDWKEGKEFALANGIKEVETFGGHTELHYKSDDMICEGVEFKNFPNLYTDEVRVNNCVFEDCNNVNLENGSAIGCTFKNIGDMLVRNSSISESIFCDMVCEGEEDCIVFLEDSNITNCTFENIEIQEGAYFCDSAGEAIVEYCSFKNCIVEERFVEDLFHGEEKKKFSKKTLHFSILNAETCTGLDEITVK